MFVRLFKNLIQNRVAFEGDDLLGEVAHLYPLRNEDFSFVKGFFSQDHSEEGCLAGAIGTDEADPVPHSDLKGAVPKEDLASELFLNVVKCDHRI